MAFLGYGDTWKFTAPSKQNLGEWADLLGTKAGLPETGWSEKIAGQPTSNTQNWINTAIASELEGRTQPTPESTTYNTWGEPKDFTPIEDFPDRQTTPQTTTPQTTAPVDLSNPVKRAEYAQSLGYDTWDQYQNDLRGQGSQPSEEDLRKKEQEAVDNIFSDIKSYLDQARGTLRGGKESLKSDIGTQEETNLQTLRGDYEAGQERIEGQGLDAEQKRINAENRARQLHDELSMGGQQRFGGATSAGQAYSELMGRETQRAQQMNMQEYQQAMRQINSAYNQVERDYTQGKQQITQQAQMARNEIMRDFNNKMLEIDQMETTAAGNKEAMKLDRLSQLRNQVQESKVQEQNWLRQLETMRQANEMELQNYAQQLAMQGQMAQQAAGGMQSYNPELDVSDGGTTAVQEQMRGIGVPEDEKRFENIFDVTRASRDRGALTPGLSNILLQSQGQQPRY